MITYNLLNMFKNESDNELKFLLFLLSAIMIILDILLIPIQPILFIIWKIYIKGSKDNG